MSAFMCSIQVTNSLSSRGRSGSRTRWTATPSISSSAGDSSRPRASTCTSTSCATRPSASLRTWRARPPSISGGYSQERIRIPLAGPPAGRVRGPARARAARGRGTGAESAKAAIAASSAAAWARTRSAGSRRPARASPGTPSRSPGARAARAPRAPARSRGRRRRGGGRNVRSSAARAANASSATAGESQVEKSFRLAPARRRASRRSTGSTRSSPSRHRDEVEPGARPRRAPRAATPAPRTTSGRAARCRARSVSSPGRPRSAA